MSPYLVTLVSLVISGIALAFLNHTDAKRRRTYNMPVWEKPKLRSWIWLLVFLPLPILIIIEQWAALVMWATAISLIGWGLAVQKPVKHSLNIEK